MPDREAVLKEIVERLLALASEAISLIEDREQRIRLAKELAAAIREGKEPR